MDNFNYIKYLAENRINEEKFDVATTEKIARQIADAFEAEDKELDLKYSITPGTEPSSFDLDVSKGPNTPDTDSLGQDIKNYLGDYAGGSFYIKDGIVYNAAMRNAPVAKVSADGDVEMISAEEARASIGDEIDMDRYNDELDMKRMEENMENTKVKVSELKAEIKEMILASMAEGYETATPDDDDYDSVQLALKQAGITEEEEDDIELEDEAEMDAEEAPAEEPAAEPSREVGLTPEEQSIQASLKDAYDNAMAMGDEKLAAQIGNSITFFTRTHVVER